MLQLMIINYHGVKFFSIELQYSLAKFNPTNPLTKLFKNKPSLIEKAKTLTLAPISNLEKVW